MKLTQLHIWDSLYDRTVCLKGKNEKRILSDNEVAGCKSNSKGSCYANYKLFGAYAITSPNFKAANTDRIREIEIVTIDEPLDLNVIKLEITKNASASRAKPGIFALYSFILNDVMYDKEKINPDIIFSGSKIEADRRTIIVTCPPQKTKETLKLLSNSYINTKFEQHYLDTAKDIAPVAFFISKKNDDYRKEFEDIPQEMTEEEYENLISSITADDINNYNKQLINNSKISVTVITSNENYKNYPIEKTDIEYYLKI